MRQRGRIVLLVVFPVVLMLLPALVLVQLGTSPPYDPVAWAQASTCGNAILEPGEECDPPGSITCPPGSPAGAILPCNADCSCAQAPAPLDHFQCYALKARHFAPVTVTVVDEFGTLVEQVRAPNRLCAPADNDGGGIGDPTDHLTAYEPEATWRPGVREAHGPDGGEPVRNPPARRAAAVVAAGAEQQGRRGADTAARPLPVLRHQALEGGAEVRPAHRDVVEPDRDGHPGAAAAVPSLRACRQEPRGSEHVVACRSPPLLHDAFRPFRGGGAHDREPVRPAGVSVSTSAGNSASRPPCRPRAARSSS